MLETEHTDSLSALRALKVESFWWLPKKDADSLTHFYVVCSERVFSLNKSYCFVECEELPEGCKAIEFSEDVNQCSKPTEELKDYIHYVGTELGDDITVVLRSGAFFYRYLDYNPESEESEADIDFFTTELADKKNMKISPDEMDAVECVFLER